MNIKVFFFIVNSLLFFSAICQDCMICQTKLIEVTKKFRQKSEEHKTLSIQIEHSKKEINSYISLIDKLNLKLKKEDFVLGKFENYNEIQKLKDQLENEKRVNFKIQRKLKNEIKENIIEIKENKQIIVDFSNKLMSLNTQLENEKIKIQELTNIINCIKDFEVERLQPDIKTVETLQEARRKYEYYTELKKNPNAKKAVKDSLISEVVSAYERYKSITKTKICGSYNLSFISDNLSGLDNLNIARIYGYNEGNAIDRIPGENKVNEATSKLMVAIGNALEKGFYETRSESRNLLLELNEIVDNIGNLALVERRPGSENSEVLYNLKQIIDLYNDEKYYEALVQYDKYQKYLTLIEIEKSNHAMVDEINFMVGNTLLWNLADFNENSKNILKGEWAEELGDYKSIGRKLLTDVANNKKANLKIRQLSLISKNKYYEN